MQQSESRSEEKMGPFPHGRSTADDAHPPQNDEGKHTLEAAPGGMMPEEAQAVAFERLSDEELSLVLAFLHSDCLATCIGVCHSLGGALQKGGSCFSLRNGRKTEMYTLVLASFTTFSRGY